MNKLKEIKNILLSSNMSVEDILSNIDISNYSYCIDRFNDISFFKNTTQNLGEIFLFEPRKRIAYDPAEDVLNFHTLWLSNHPDWKNYPKRDRAVIMESNGHNDLFGDYCYRMLIPNNTKLAVADEEDLVMVFSDPLSMYEFNVELMRLFNYFEKYYGLKIPNDIESNYSSLLQTINQVNVNILKFLNDYDNSFKNKNIPKELDFRHFNIFIEYIKYNGYDLLDTIKNYFSPASVSILKLEQYKYKYENEIWADVPCIGILTEKHNKNYNKIINMVTTFLEDYIEEDEE